MSDNGTQLSLFDANGNPVEQPNDEAEKYLEQQEVETTNDFVRYVIVGYREDGSLDIGIPEGMTVSIPDLWAFARVLQLRGDNVFNLVVEEVHKPVINGVLNAIAEQQSKQ